MADPKRLEKVPDPKTIQDRAHVVANEISGITGGSWVAPTYDAAGSMIKGPEPGDETDEQFYLYDAWNPLRRIKKNREGMTEEEIRNIGPSNLTERRDRWKHIVDEMKEKSDKQSTEK